MIKYASSQKEKSIEQEKTDIDIETGFTKIDLPSEKRIGEDEIRVELERTGKIDPENQLNCAACGYDTCKDKAVAVLMGMAEPEMCLPYMRKLAERRTDRILETSPNGIVILNQHFEIISTNPAFREIFRCSDAVLGKHISYLMDPEGFERLVTGKDARISRTLEHKKYNRTCHEILYTLEEEKQFVGIFVNVTEVAKQKAQLDVIKAEAMQQAEELLSHQVDMAQQMTRFLGENTARGEELVAKLINLVEEKTDDKKIRGKFGWDTSTLK